MRDASCATDHADGGKDRHVSGRKGCFLAGFGTKIGLPKDNFVKLLHGKGREAG